MRRNLLTLFILLFSIYIYSQNENPFKQFGYDVLVASSSKGEFNEFHDQTDVVEIGSVLFNTKTHEIVKILDKDETTINISSATAAMSIDPLCEKYYWISPYAYVANNPLKFVDPDGRKILGTDNKPVTFNQASGWSSNASGDVIRVGNSLLKTNTGTERLNYMLKHDENISITISPDVVREGGGYSTGNNTRTGTQLHSDGSITVKEHKITINEGSISKLIDSNAGENQLKGLSMEEAIGVVAGHESGHTEKENTRQSYENNYKEANHDLEKKPNEIDVKIVEELKNK